MACPRFRGYFFVETPHIKTNQGACIHLGLHEVQLAGACFWPSKRRVLTEKDGTGEEVAGCCAGSSSRPGTEDCPTTTTGPQHSMELVDMAGKSPELLQFVHNPHLPHSHTHRDVSGWPGLASAC
jgi:hypothetical protein